MNSIIIGVDIGTTKLCAVALDATCGAILAVESAANTAHLPAEADGAEQDASKIIAIAFNLLALLTARPEVQSGQIVALGVTGQMHGVVLVDKTGAIRTPLTSWQDRRGDHKYANSGHSYAEEVAARLHADASLLGCTPATSYGAVTLLRLQQAGMLPANCTALTIHDALVLALCGRAVTDPTDAASWGIFDVAAGDRWVPSLAAAFPSLYSALPEVLPTGSLAGALSAQVAALTGLPTGLPVAVAIGDNQASFLGSVPAPQGTVLINLGTGGQMSVPTDQYIFHAPLETRPFIGGSWLLVGASLCGGHAYSVLEGFIRQLGHDLFALAPGELYETMNTLAAAAPADCQGLSAATLFAGSRLDPQQRGCITGINESNLTPGNLIRAVINGMVDELVAFYRIAQDSGAHPTALSGAGNAVRRNAVVRQELAHRFAMPLGIPPHTEEAAMGAALVGGVAAGIFPDWAAAAQLLFHKCNPGIKGVE